MPPLLSRQHYSVFRVIPASALLIALAAGLAACTGSSAPPKPAATASGIAATQVNVTGAGSTFDAPFFNLAFPAYQQAHPGVTVSYAAVGSSAGIARFTAGQADFGATDVPASAADLAGARGGPALQVPVDLGAVTVAYNVLTRTSAPLKLTGPVLAQIFLGQITKWTDPAITALNPGADLPDVHITVVHRSDGSGTSYIFSDYLSAVSPAWAKAVGVGRTLKWPVGYAAKGNPGVATAMDHIPYSIGYVERAYTSGTELGAAAIRNQAGNFVSPATAAIAADAAARPAISAASFSIVNGPGPGAYPISGYSWVVVSARQPSATTGKALTGLLSWLTRAGQSYAATLGYVPLPSAIQQLAASTLSRVTGPDGSPLTG